MKIAREHWSHLEQADKKRNIIEIRDYAEDVEDENCTDFSYDTVKWRGVNEIRNREEVVDELTELIMQFERDHNPFQTDVYMYIGEDGNATLNTFINVGGNSWLDDDHITIYRDKPHYDDPIDEATIDACRGDFEQTAEEWIRYAEMDERKDREWR